MKKSKIALMAILIALVFLGGCAQMQQLANKMQEYAAEQRLENYAKCQDKQMLDAFYSLSSDGKQSEVVSEFKADGFDLEQWSQTSVSLKKKIYDETNMQYIYQKMSTYSYDSSYDVVAKAYVSVAKKRGNKVKLYKPAMGKILNGIYKQPFDKGPQRQEWYGLDNALIEFDKEGRVVSTLVRAHQARTSLGVDSYQFATVYYGQANARHLENNVKNSDFADYVIREL